MTTPGGSAAGGGRGGTVTHPRRAPRRSATVRAWWAKALARAVEESAYSDTDLRRGRALARQGAVGVVAVSAGEVVAAVDDADDTFTVQAHLPVLDDASLDALVEVVASGAGWVGSLLGGDLPHALLEAWEEAGVELLPYGGEFGSTCTCAQWSDPCVHALALLTQVVWLVESDPFVLTHLRGVGREEVLARLAALRSGGDGDDIGEVVREDDLTVALEAAERAAAMLGEAAAVGEWGSSTPP